MCDEKGKVRRRGGFLLYFFPNTCLIYLNMLSEGLVSKKEADMHSWEYLVLLWSLRLVFEFF